jgi:hypothetical protein
MAKLPTDLSGLRAAVSRSKIDGVRIPRRVPERQNIDGAAILIDGVNNPVLGLSSDAEQITAVRYPVRGK